MFSTDAILDAAREVIIARGLRGATVEAIGRAAGVPVGSIYHRFSSIDELLARVWLRAVQRSQTRALAVPTDPAKPLESAVEVAVAMYDHCLADPHDTLLLDVLHRGEVLALDLGPLAADVEGANDGIVSMMDALARSLFGRAGLRGRDLVLLALVDLPHGFAHRQLVSGLSTPARRRRLPAAVRAVLAGDGD